MKRLSVNVDWIQVFVIIVSENVDWMEVFVIITTFE